MNWAKRREKKEKQELLYFLKYDLLSDKVSGRRTTGTNKVESLCPWVADGSQRWETANEVQNDRRSTWDTTSTWVSIWLLDAEWRAHYILGLRQKEASSRHGKTCPRHSKKSNELNKDNTNHRIDDTELKPIYPLDLEAFALQRQLRPDCHRLPTLRR